MKQTERNKEPVLLTGNNKLTYSLVICLRNAGHPVLLCTEKKQEAWDYIRLRKKEIDAWSSGRFGPFNIKITDQLYVEKEIRLAIVVTEEDTGLKKQMIAKLESVLPSDALITINTETIPLNILQQEAQFPQRILGANWVEPVYTTFFLEIIANQLTEQSCVEYLNTLASTYWGKDPYVINGETGIRMRLLVALIREAFYLVENGYADFEDIDRACRNDAGYYLPFVGNLRYMDLMGPYAYGIVMKDLNPELATDKMVPDFFSAMIRNEESGMETGKGFYTYAPGESDRWAELLAKFSYQVNELAARYPFNYKT